MICPALSATRNLEGVEKCLLLATERGTVVTERSGTATLRGGLGRASELGAWEC